MSRIEDEARTSLTAQQKDERRQDNSDKERPVCHHRSDLRRQDNSDKKRLARHHWSDLLRLLTHEWIGEEKNGVISPAL